VGTRSRSAADVCAGRWALGWLVLSTASVVLVMWLDTRLVDRVATWTGRTPPAVDTVLGWTPVGGLATYGAYVLLWRARRLSRGSRVTRPLDRSAVALTALWAGVAWAFVPHRNGSGESLEERLAVTGPDFTDAATWSATWLLVVAALAAVPLVLMVIRPPESADDDPVRAHRWAAALLGPPYALLLVGLLLR
jgi:hypothetical protein